MQVIPNHTSLPIFLRNEQNAVWFWSTILWNVLVDYLSSQHEQLTVLMAGVASTKETLAHRQ